MKNKLYLFSFALFTTTFNIAQNKNEKYFHDSHLTFKRPSIEQNHAGCFNKDSTYYFTWDTLNNWWRLRKKYLPAFNSDGRKSSILIQFWNGTNWRNFTKSIYTYNSNGKIIDSLQQRWISNIWINIVKYLYIYDNAGNKISELIQYWKDTSFVSQSRVIYTYDVNGNQTHEIFQSRKDSFWENQTQLIYTYDAKENQTNELIQRWHDSVWKPEKQYVYTYDINGNQLSGVIKRWYNHQWRNGFGYFITYNEKGQQTSYTAGESWMDSIPFFDYKDTSIYNIDGILIENIELRRICTSGWVNSIRNIYAYDAHGNKINFLIQSWNDSVWKSLKQTHFSYNPNDLLISELVQKWNKTVWVNYIQYGYTYDENGNQINSKIKNFDAIGVRVKSGDSCIYFYSCPTGITEMKISTGVITLYPNPFSNSINIEIQNVMTFEFKNTDIKIYSLLGAEVYHQNIRSSSEVLKINLVSGIYFYQLIDDNKIITHGKIVRQ